MQLAFTIIPGGGETTWTDLATFWVLVGIALWILASACVLIGERRSRRKTRKAVSATVGREMKRLLSESEWTDDVAAEREMAETKAGADGGR